MPYRNSELRRAYANAWYAKNRERVAAQRLAWAQANPEKRKFSTRKHHLRRKFNLTPERDILCHLCNTAIGKLKHNPTILRRAAEYIERHANPQSLSNF